MAERTSWERDQGLSAGQARRPAGRPSGEARLRVGTVHPWGARAASLEAVAAD
jgi:hypothetical protein